MGLTDKNLYAYCDNNPVIRTDHGGQFWDTVFDVISLAASVVDVVKNPKDTMAWVGLALDIVDVAVPVVSGLGEVSRAIKTADKAADAVKATKVAKKADAAADTGKALKNARSSAVRKAWKNEVDLVERTGKGTRAWTPAEIDELLSTGKVKGYQGHHMKSVNEHQDLAGDPYNIQFLTRKEHFDAHRGNWRNATYGRYTP